MARTSRLLDVAESDKSTLNQLLSSGVQQVRVVLRALALRQLGEGRTASEVAAFLGLTGKAIRALVRRYDEGGLERAVYEKATTGKEAAAGRQHGAADCGDGVRRTAVRTGPLERTADRGAGDQKKNRAQAGTGNSTRVVGKPRAQAVAGKKCGVCHRSTPRI
jgi:hypothetical protein